MRLEVEVGLLLLDATILAPLRGWGWGGCKNQGIASLAIFITKKTGSA